jgi:hypothetical protein
MRGVILTEAARLNQFHSRLRAAANKMRRTVGKKSLSSKDIHSLGFSGGGTIAQVAAITRPYAIAGYVNHSGILVNILTASDIKANPPGLFTFGLRDEIYAMTAGATKPDKAILKAAVALTHVLPSGDIPHTQDAALPFLQQYVSTYPGFKKATAALPDQGRLLANVAASVGFEAFHKGGPRLRISAMRRKLKVAYLFAEGESIRPKVSAPPSTVMAALHASLTTMQVNRLDVHTLIRPGMDHSVDERCARAAHQFISGRLQTAEIGTTHVSQLPPHDLDRDQLEPAFALRQAQIKRARGAMTQAYEAASPQPAFAQLTAREMAGHGLQLVMANIAARYRVAMRHALPALYRVANGPTNGFRRLAAGVSLTLLGSIASAQAHHEALARNGRLPNPAARSQTQQGP